MWERSFEISLSVLYQIVDTRAGWFFQWYRYLNWYSKFFLIHYFFSKIVYDFRDCIVIIDTFGWHFDWLVNEWNFFQSLSQLWYRHRQNAPRVACAPTNVRASSKSIRKETNSYQTFNFIRQQSSNIGTFYIGRRRSFRAFELRASISDTLDRECVKELLIEASNTTVLDVSRISHMFFAKSQTEKCELVK